MAGAEVRAGVWIRRQPTSVASVPTDATWIRAARHGFGRRIRRPRWIQPALRSVDSRGLRRFAIAALPFAAATIPIHCGSRRRFHSPPLRKRRGELI
uniref:Uncharacterized protein n=1 Tax=Oryza nivara TaxID=4536 RepID=A0A0E0HEF5_ORYNI